ncbi:hypothetical protein Tco_0654718 [Tanacetum coccineum]|uniref:Reverse transcriptase domain-containing protein n=1 Tax=Tanacetum coccineum TaxID=301880 RepID=A0ABQ4X444_9ASTR
MHVDFWNIYSDKKCRVAWSESKSIQNDLKCRFSLYLYRIKSSVAYPNLKPFLLGNKFQIKFDLLSRYELPPSLVRFLCQTFQRFRRHASHTKLFDQEVKSILWQRFGEYVSQDKNQVCLLCEVILKQIPAFNFFCASLESIIAIENTWEWVLSGFARRKYGTTSLVVPGFFVGRENGVWEDPESVILARQRNLDDPSLLLDFEEINMNSNNVQGAPPAGPPPQNHNGLPGPNLHMRWLLTWERYKLSIDRCLNHNMLPVTQIDTFYNGLTLRHRDTINSAAGGTFMKRRPKECYDLIKNMTAYHIDWDILTHRGESSTTSSSCEIVTPRQGGNPRHDERGNHHNTLASI